MSVNFFVPCDWTMDRYFISIYFIKFSSRLLAKQIRAVDFFYFHIYIFIAAFINFLMFDTLIIFFFRMN